MVVLMCWAGGKKKGRWRLDRGLGVVRNEAYGFGSLGRRGKKQGWI